MLWIAFKFYYLRDEEQLIKITFWWAVCCELLSNFIIFGTKNNQIILFTLSKWVVNCFQILLSSGRRTTCKQPFWYNYLLWIAFKFYYLRDEEQQESGGQQPYQRCELLSNFIIFGTKNNFLFQNRRTRYVVNCFQILLSSGRRTTFYHCIT